MRRSKDTGPIQGLFRSNATRHPCSVSVAVITTERRARGGRSEWSRFTDGPPRLNNHQQRLIIPLHERCARRYHPTPSCQTTAFPSTVCTTADPQKHATAPSAGLSILADAPCSARPPGVGGSLVAELCLHGFPLGRLARRLQPRHVPRRRRPLLSEESVRLLEETPRVVVPAGAALSRVRPRRVHLLHAGVHPGPEVGVALRRLRGPMAVGRGGSGGCSHVTERGIEGQEPEGLGFPTEFPASKGQNRAALRPRRFKLSSLSIHVQLSF